MSKHVVGASAAVGAMMAAVSVLAVTAGVASADSVEPAARTCFDVSGSPGDAAVVNLTPVGSLASGSGQLVSSDVIAPPVYSNVNFGPGTIDPNVAASAIGADGQACFVNNSPARTGIVADHLGTIDAASYTQATPSGAPTRVVDTRIALGGNRLGPGARLCFAIDGLPGDAAVVNLTPVLAAGTGNGQLVSSDVSAPPVYSNVNWTTGSIDPNVAIAQVGADGQTCFVNNASTAVDLVADHVGTIDAAVYTPASPTGAPVRSLDSRSTASRVDLILRPNGVGSALFGSRASSAIEYLESGMGPRTSDVSEQFPNPNSFIGFETADGADGFAYPHSREVCFENRFCAVFGGASPATLGFVGYLESDDGPGRPLTTASGATIGDRGDTSPGVVTVNNGGCYSFGGGTVDGIDATLRSDGEPFLEITPGGTFVANTPPLADVIILTIFAGDLFVSLEGDC